MRAIARKGELFITDANTPVAIARDTHDVLAAFDPTSVGAVLRPFPSADDDTGVRDARNDWRGQLPSYRTGRVARARHGA